MTHPAGTCAAESASQHKVHRTTISQTISSLRGISSIRNIVFAIVIISRDAVIHTSMRLIMYRCFENLSTQSLGTAFDQSQLIASALTANESWNLRFVPVAARRSATRHLAAL